MALPDFKTGPLSRCCCCSLRSGTIIITVGHFVYMAIIFIVAVVSYVKAKEGLDYAVDSRNYETKEQADAAQSVSDILKKVLTPIVVMSLIILFLEAFFAVLVLVGVVKKNPSWMKPWIFYNAHQWIVSAIIAHYMLAILWGWISWAAGLGSYVGFVIILLIQGYCILVVYSYNNQLERQGFEQEEVGRLKSLP